MERAETIDAMGSLRLSTLSTKDFALVAVEGPYTGQVFALDRELVRIGRSDWCDISLAADAWVSNLHCECWLDEQGVRIRDLKSRNGIQVEGLAILEAYLPIHGKLRVGQSVFDLTSRHQKREIAIPYQDKSGLLIGKNREMRTIFSMIERLGKRKVNTLLRGETGVGKTSIAKAIHDAEEGSSPFVVVNCGALPASLIEAALFGHEKGAFTGADKAHKGFFQQAHGGTLFLDEIAELPLALQPKLLDVLERHVVRPLGGEKEVSVDFRLITATHRDLRKEVEAGRFREDLFFRLSVVELTVPSLRERLEDLPLLISEMLKLLSPSTPIYLTQRALRRLEEYLWPGNLRELRNVLERAITFLEGDVIDLPQIVLPQTPESAQRPRPVMASVPSLPSLPMAPQIQALFPLSAHQPSPSLKDLLAETERVLLAQALKETEGNVPMAAQLLHISESWLYNRIKRYELK